MRVAKQPVKQVVIQSNGMNSRAVFAAMADQFAAVDREKAANLRRSAALAKKRRQK